MMARLYLSEEHAQLKSLLQLLHDQEQVRGVTVFRGIAGYGDNGEVHGTGLVDLSFNLPLVIEFFDSPEKVERVLNDLAERMDSAHMVYWTAEQMVKD